MVNETEDQLVADVLVGDLEAFSALVRRYQDFAYGVAIGILSDFELARDVVQEAFLCAYRDLHKLRDTSRFGGWLRGIVRHTAFRALRELRRVRAMAGELAGEEAGRGPAPSPLHAVTREERHAIVRQALRRLNDKNREAVSLYYVDGLSYADIAGFLGVTETAVQGRLQRARAILRKELLTMVAETYDEQRLQAGFAAEIKALLERAAVRGEEHERAIQRLAEMGIDAVAPLCDALVDPRAPVKRAAAAALCRIGDPRALRPVLRILYSGDWCLHDLFSSGRILSIPGIRDELLRIVRDGPAGQRYGAVEALAHAEGDTEVFEAILGVFRQTHSYNTLNALLRLCPARKTEFLADALTASNVGQHSWVVWLCLKHGILPPLDACLTALVQAGASGPAASIGQLALRHGEKARHAVEGLLRGGEPDTRAAAALALAPERCPTVRGVLLAEMGRGGAGRDWVGAVARALVRYYHEDVAARAQAPAFPASNAQAVAWALAKSRDVRQGGDARGLLRHGTPAIRAAGLRILARRERAASLPELRECLRAGKPRKVAQGAFREMLRLRGPATQTAVDMLTSEHWTERKAAVCLLRRWGKLTPEQRAAAEGDDHVAVRHAARWHPGYTQVHPMWGRPLRDNTSAS